MPFYDQFYATIDPQLLLNMPSISPTGASPTVHAAHPDHSYSPQSVVPNVTEGRHVEGRGRTNPGPQDGPLIYGEQDPHTFNSQPRFSYPEPVANSQRPSPTPVTGPPSGNEYHNSIEIDEPPPADPRATPDTPTTNDFYAPPYESNLLDNRKIQEYVRSQRDTPSDLSREVTKGSPQAKACDKLILTHPEIQGYVNFVKKKALKQLIQWVVESDWYQKDGRECLPDPSSGFFKIILKRPSRSSPHSPFSAFISPRAPYCCLLCGDPKHRTLERAFGHARAHFNFKPVGGFTDQNSRNDQERRAKKQKECEICHKKVLRQNFSRHKKVHEN